MEAAPNVNEQRISVDDARMSSAGQSVASLNRTGLYDGFEVATGFDYVTHEWVFTQQVTGKRMMEVLEKIFMELDEMAMPMSYVVSCPHGGPPTPPRDGLVYLGRKLDFCDHCHDAIITEMRDRNRELDKLLRPLREMEPCT